MSDKTKYTKVITYIITVAIFVYMTYIR